MTPIQAARELAQWSWSTLRPEHVSAQTQASGRFVSDLLVYGAIMLVVERLDELLDATVPARITKKQLENERTKTIVAYNLERRAVLETIIKRWLSERGKPHKGLRGELDSVLYYRVLHNYNLWGVWDKTDNDELLARRARFEQLRTAAATLEPPPTISRPGTKRQARYEDWLVSKPLDAPAGGA